MKIPSDPLDREYFYNSLIEKCMVSRDERRSDYASLRSYYLFGNDIKTADNDNRNEDDRDKKHNKIWMTK